MSCVGIGLDGSPKHNFYLNFTINIFPRGGIYALDYRKRNERTHHNGATATKSFYDIGSKIYGLFVGA